MMKNVVIIAGPSAVGKTTVAQYMMDADSRYELVRSVTSRAPRGDGFDDEYIYESRENFLKLIREGGVLEHTEYAGNLYGTPRSEIDRICAEGGIPLLILDIEGVKSLSRAEGIASCSVYVYDDISVMDERLEKRFLSGEPDEAAKKRCASRKAQNRKDYRDFPEVADSFYILVHNKRTPKETADEIRAIFEGFTHGTKKDSAKNMETARKLADSVN